MSKYVPVPYIIIYTIAVVAIAISPIDFAYKMAGLAILFILFVLATREH